MDVSTSLIIEAPADCKVMKEASSQPLAQASEQDFPGTLRMYSIFAKMIIRLSL